MEASDISMRLIQKVAFVQLVRHLYRRYEFIRVGDIIELAQKIYLLRLHELSRCSCGFATERHRLRIFALKKQLRFRLLRDEPGGEILDFLLDAVYTEANPGYYHTFMERQVRAD